MRLQSLNLRLFGHFTNKSFDFGTKPDNRSDFHLIHGLNESGKTTMIEAYIRLLYGFPHREPYDFLHKRSDLRISAVLEINGNENFFGRHPTRSNSLVNNLGKPVSETVLSGALAGLAIDDYRKLFCLNDETIEKGGDEIAASKGAIGHLLYSAVSGISGLSEILADVENTTGELYKKRGQKTKFAESKRTYDAVLKDIKLKDVTAHAYNELKSALERAEAAERAAFTKRKEKLIKKSLLEAEMHALPLLKQLESIEKQLAGTSYYPNWLGVDDDELAHLETQQTKHQSARDQLQQRIMDIEGAIEAINFDYNNLGLLNKLKDVDELRSRYRTAVLDLPKRQAEREQILAVMREAASTLGLPAQEDARKIVLDPVQLAKFEQCWTSVQNKQMKEQSKLNEIDDLEAKILESENELAELAAKAPIGRELAELFASQDVDSISHDHDLARRELESAKQKLASELLDLTARTLKFTEPPMTCMTAIEADSLYEQLQAIEHKLDVRSEKLNDHQTKLRVSSRTLKRLYSQPGLISDSAAERVRNERNRLWEAHISEFSDESASAFEAAMHRTDEVADQRILQATELGQIRQIENELEEMEENAEAVSKEKDGLEQQAKGLRDRSNKVSTDLGFDPPLEPKALAKWLSKLESARSTDNHLTALRKTHAETLARGQNLLHDLSKLGVSSYKHAYLREAVKQATEMVKIFRSFQQAYENKQTSVQSLMGHLRTHKSQLEKLISERAHAEAELAELAEQLLPQIDCTAMNDASIRILHKLREQSEKLADFEHRTDSMKGDMKRFTEAIHILAESSGVATNETPLEVFDRLHSIAESANEANKNLDRLCRDLKTKREAFIEACEELHHIDARTAEIAAQFNTKVPKSSLRELRHSVARAQEIIEKRKILAELEEDIVASLSVSDINEARQRVSGLEIDEIRSNLEAAKQDADLAENEYFESVNSRAAAQKNLHAVAGDDDVATLVERRKTLELEMQDIALTYLELHLGRSLAEAALRKYREVHRSDMLRATEDAFLELTNGAYSSLQPETDGKNEVLFALDPSGRSKRVHALSKGTRFQLYLALRAAAYEQFAASGTILPFFCDDIFETFDEERTRSACRLMSRIGRTGQAIYLTHHKHVAELAREVCGQDVRIYEL